MLPYQNGWTPPREAHADQATELYREATAGAKEVTVTCRYTGSHIMRATCGAANDRVFVFIDDPNRQAYWAEAPSSDASQLFQGLVTELCRRQAFVNSDPASPEYLPASPVWRISWMKCKEGCRQASNTCCRLMRTYSA